MRIRALILALAILPATSFAGIVINGSFETGDFFGWTPSGNTDDTFVDDTLPFSGAFAASLGPVDADGVLTQLLPTIPGMAYNLIYWLQNEGGTPNSFFAMWDGNLLSGSVVTDDNVGFEYKPFTFYGLVATSSSTPLMFEFEHTPAFWHLDSISVEPVPEPSPGPLIWMVGLVCTAWHAQRRHSAT